jgi:putative ABC transport system substrate-binding protein
MTRLAILLAVILAAGATACGAAAQQFSGEPRVGLLNLSSPEWTRAGDKFREGMRSLGWVEGDNIWIEDRFANGDPARLSVNAAEFAAAKVDVIVAIAALSARAARGATSTIPIVTPAADPHYGFIASLARPGGNVTGLSTARRDGAARNTRPGRRVHRITGAFAALAFSRSGRADKHHNAAIGISSTRAAATNRLS